MAIVLKKTEHQLKELRTVSAGSLPGKSLVVYDPVQRLPMDIFPCEDGHAQERSLLKTVLLSIQANDVWVADRNFCTLSFTCGIDSKQACFIIREHKKYPWKPCGKEKCIGKVDTGQVYQQRIKVVDGAGKEHLFRRIRVSLKIQTPDVTKKYSL